MPDYTLVCGVDAKHIRQLAWVWPTWKLKKPSLLEHPMIVFYDWKQVKGEEITAVVDHPDLSLVPWPPEGVVHDRTTEDKWGDPQRYKMLAGFVYVPAEHVKTEYWLKLDVDTVATGQDDWIDEKWFENDPAIVAQSWGFTKPPDQMQVLDKWARTVLYLRCSKSLNLIPKEGSNRLGHKRIISWCGFFNTEFSKECKYYALSVGYGYLPVPSQDGFMWFMAKRLGYDIVRTQMKSLGWEHWGTEYNIRQAVERVLSNGQ
ncbi:unnamed protein product [marine sediment metagenome]|uniref:DUF5672 domain-containing protein n=1 Tax=marine sediment metagenome TaxID=412755 RepID=X1BKJ0_9ZZZZ